MARPSTRWFDLLLDDLRAIGVRSWRLLAQDKEDWSEIVLEAKTSRFVAQLEVYDISCYRNYSAGVDSMESSLNISKATPSNRKMFQNGYGFFSSFTYLSDSARWYSLPFYAVQNIRFHNPFGKAPVTISFADPPDFRISLANNVLSFFHPEPLQFPFLASQRLIVEVSLDQLVGMVGYFLSTMAGILVQENER